MCHFLSASSIQSVRKTRGHTLCIGSVSLCRPNTSTETLLSNHILLYDLMSSNRLECSANWLRVYRQKIWRCCPRTGESFVLPPSIRSLPAISLRLLPLKWEGDRLHYLKGKDEADPVLPASLPLGGAFVEQIDWPLVTWKHTHTPKVRNHPDNSHHAQPQAISET